MSCAWKSCTFVNAHWELRQSKLNFLLSNIDDGGFKEKKEETNVFLHERLSIANINEIFVFSLKIVKLEPDWISHKAALINKRIQQWIAMYWFNPLQYSINN